MLQTSLMTSALGEFSNAAVIRSGKFCSLDQLVAAIFNVGCPI